MSLVLRERTRPGSRIAIAAVAAGILAVGLAQPAFAQSTGGGAGGNIGTFIQNVIDILNNNVVRGLAVIAVIATGIGWMFGSVDLRRAGTVILGIIVIFSASTIVGLVTGSGAG